MHEQQCAGEICERAKRATDLALHEQHTAGEMGLRSLTMHGQHTAVLEQFAEEKGEREQDANEPQGSLAVPGQFALREKRKAGRPRACKCRQCGGSIRRAAVKKDKAKNRQVARRAANQTAGDKTE